MGLNIMQLSDIHLCGKNSPPAESILMGDTFPEGAPDVILVTGDIFDYSAFSKVNRIIRLQKKAKILKKL